MNGPARSRGASRSERKKAQTAVSAVLVRHGVRRGPRGAILEGPALGGPFQRGASQHRPSHQGPSQQGNDQRLFGDRLRSAFEELGASFGSAFLIFGSYLSRRPDLLPPADCLALAEILPPDVTDSAPLHRAFADLGGVSELLTGIAPRPRRRGPLRLQYQARLNGEHPVLVEIVPEQLERDLETSLPNLALLRGSWGDLPIAASLESVLDELRPWLEAQLDLRPAVADLEAFTQDPEGSRRLTLPRPYAYLCGPRRLVLEDSGGTPLSDMDDGARQAPPRQEPSLQRLARRITLAWLVQAMVTRSYVAELAEDDLLQLPSQSLALRSGGPLRRMAEEAQGNWWSYLQAALAEDPGAACTWLLRECVATGAGADEGELQLRLRQIVPFRDGSWTDEGETLAETLFLQWRIARECGFHLRPQALDVAQGIFAVAALGRSLDPQGDPLQDALEDLRWMTGWSQLRQWANLPHMARLLEHNAEALMELPTKIEQFLDRHPSQPPQPHPPVSSHGPTVAALMALVAATLLTDHLADAGLFGSYGEPLTAVVFLAVGLYTLRILWRDP